MPRDSPSERPGTGLRLFARCFASAARLRGRKPSGIVILNYHSVGDPVAQGIFPGNCVTTALFKKQMAFIRRHCRPLSLDKIEPLLRGETPTPDRAVAVTFDDGYRGVEDEALPILREFDIPASVFLPTDWVVTGAEKWEDRLSRSVFATSKRELVAESPGQESVTLSLRTTEQRLQAMRLLCKMAPAHSSTEPDSWTDQLIGRLGEVGASNRSLISPSEVRSLARRSDLTFGSHSASHRAMSALTESELRDDLRRARDQVTHWTNKPCRHFAYPFGGPKDISALAPPILRDLGFTVGLTTIEGYARPGDDMFSLRRILAHPDDLPSIFELKVLGAFDDYRKAYALARGRLRA